MEAFLADDFLVAVFLDTFLLAFLGETLVDFLTGLFLAVDTFVLAFLGVVAFLLLAIAFLAPAAISAALDLVATTSCAVFSATACTSDIVSLLENREGDWRQGTQGPPLLLIRVPSQAGQV